MLNFIKVGDKRINVNNILFVDEFTNDDGAVGITFSDNENFGTILLSGKDAKAFLFWLDGIACDVHTYIA